MGNEKLFTDEEKDYLERLFWEHREKINNKLNEELTILSKYKGALASSYESVGAHHNTLIGCMKDILANQDELIGLSRHLGDMAQRIESFFLNDWPLSVSEVMLTAARHGWKPEAEESPDGLLIEELQLTIRAFNCLKAEGINTINELLNYSELRLLKISNFGKKSLTETKDALGRHGWRLKNG